MQHKFTKRRLLSLSLAFSVPLVAGAAFAHEHEHAHNTDAIGKPGVATQATRVVEVSMEDSMRFKPSHIDVKRGETLRLLITNTGKLKHELVLGTAHELKEHNELMKKFPDMEHSEPNMITLAPGAKGEIVWTFNKAGKIAFACLQPGHYDAGMKGEVLVKK